jgi:hypothetical protein
MRGLRRYADRYGSVSRTIEYHSLPALSAGQRGCPGREDAWSGAGSNWPGSYLDTYRRNLGGHRPLIWGLHPYSDIGAFEKADAAHQPLPPLSSTLVAAFARDMNAAGYHQHTQIWLDEISAFQYHSMNGTPEPKWTPQVQAAAGHYLLTELPKAASGPAEPHVTRAYYLNYQADDPINSRWALILNGGQTPQPIYYTFTSR